MRDSEMLMALLKEMSDDKHGRIQSIMFLGMSDDDLNRSHQIELLVDAGHAAWGDARGDQARITNDGYDFLSAYNKQQPVRDRFAELLDKGVPYVKAALEAMKLIG